MLKIILFLTSLSILYSCSNSGNHTENIERMDKVFGCENPAKPLTPRQKKNCKARLLAEGESVFNNTSITEMFESNKTNNVVYLNSVNPYLWDAALEVTSEYPLKIADNQGGYIETDWIKDKQVIQNRCLIKIRVTSNELISTGVTTNFICQELSNGNWTQNDSNFFEEEKQITLKILSLAAEKSKSAS